MLVISSGLVITLSAHGVELLLEHQSIWSLSNESVARIAFALRNDVTVRSLAPSSKVALPTARGCQPIVSIVAVVTLGELVRSLAVGWPRLGDGLIERRRRPAAAMTEENDLVHVLSVS